MRNCFVFTYHPSIPYIELMAVGSLCLTKQRDECTVDFGDSEKDDVNLQQEKNLTANNNKKTKKEVNIR